MINTTFLGWTLRPMIEVEARPAAGECQPRRAEPWVIAGVHVSCYVALTCRTSSSFPLHGLMPRVLDRALR